MDELEEFCSRVLGDPAGAQAIAQAARETGGDDQLQRLRYALGRCRELEDAGAADVEPASCDATLAAAVAAELAAATRRLPPRQREALALRELLRLNHAQVAAVLGVDVAAVAPLLARSRLRLRAELRGVEVATSDCAERDRLLRAATLRHDREGLSDEDADWLIDHLGHCNDCVRAHAAMLEGSACYRGWRTQPGPTPTAAQT